MGKQILQNKPLIIVIIIFSLIALCCLCLTIMGVIGTLLPPELKIRDDGSNTWISDEPKDLIKLYCNAVEELDINGVQLSSDEVEDICYGEGYQVRLDNGSNEFLITATGYRGQEIALDISISFDKTSYDQNQLEIQEREEQKAEEERVRAEQEAIMDTIDEFDQSVLFSKYNLEKSDPYELRSGGENTVYFTDEFGRGLTSIDVTTNKGKITGYGVSFYSKSNLTEKEFEFIQDLIKLASGMDNIDEPMEFVRERIVIPVKDENTSVMDTMPKDWDKFEIRSARVGSSDFIFSMDIK